MNIIIEKAKRFADNYFQNPTRYEELLTAAKSKLNDIDNSLDKIKFINFLLNRNNSDYENHKLKCTEQDNCRYNYAYENIAYYLCQELNRLGIHFNDDTFSEEDKQATESKLSQILKDLDEVKAGQQVIYEDLTKEINELRELYFLGKKKWYQLLIGKSVDMVASGIVSELVSKQIIEELKKSLPVLIGH